MKQEQVFAAMKQAVVTICDVEPASLHEDTDVTTLDIDSMTAAEIVVHVQSIIGAEIDFRKLSKDWSGFTLDALAAELLRCADPKAS